MDKQELYSIDDAIYKQIQEERKRKEVENKIYFDGMEKGAELLMKAVRAALDKETTDKGLK